MIYTYIRVPPICCVPRPCTPPHTHTQLGFACYDLDFKQLEGEGVGVRRVLPTESTCLRRQPWGHVGQAWDTARK